MDGGISFIEACERLDLQFDTVTREATQSSGVSCGESSWELVAAPGSLKSQACSFLVSPIEPHMLSTAHLICASGNRVHRSSAKTRSLPDIAVRDEAKKMRPDARPQAWKNRRCIPWNTLRIFSGRERHRWSRIVRRSRKVNVGQAPRTEKHERIVATTPSINTRLPIRSLKCSEQPPWRL